MEIYSEDKKTSKKIELPKGFMLICETKNNNWENFFACKIKEHENASNDADIEIFEIVKDGTVYIVHLYQDSMGEKKYIRPKKDYYDCRNGACTFKPS